MQTQPASETLFRAVIMGAFLALIGWVACRYTTIPRLGIQKAITWYEQQAQRPELALQTGHDSGERDSAAAPARLFSGAESEARPLAGYPDDRNEGSFIGTQLPTSESSVRQLSYDQPTRPPPATAGAEDSRSAVEQRLRELGAVYLLLESWGRDDPRYRFHCQVALAGGAEATRSFEATGSAPDEAMTTVLRQVEAWRGRVNDSGW
jgi:hypothetical protein